MPQSSPACPLPCPQQASSALESPTPQGTATQDHSSEDARALSTGVRREGVEAAGEEAAEPSRPPFGVLSQLPPVSFQAGSPGPGQPLTVSRPPQQEAGGRGGGRGGRAGRGGGQPGREVPGRRCVPCARASGHVRGRGRGATCRPGPGLRPHPEVGPARPQHHEGAFLSDHLPPSRLGSPCSPAGSLTPSAAWERPPLRRGVGACAPPLPHAWKQHGGGEAFPHPERELGLLWPLALQQSHGPHRPGQRWPASGGAVRLRG